MVLHLSRRIGCLRWLPIALLATLTSTASLSADNGTGAAPASDQTDFFERKIRPVLVEHCYECHAGDAEVIQGGLRLDDPQALRRGGDSGAAVTPGAPEKSLLLAAMRYDDLEMPPDGKLNARILNDFETWIRGGAVDPRLSDPSSSSLQPESETDAKIDWQEAQQFWAFQTPQRHEAPPVTHAHWIQNRIDPFVLARLERAGLQPNQPAHRIAFIRRLTFDLTGLPPTPAEVDAYVNDDRAGAKRRLIDRLLASPAHAERWTRLWLDISRYAEDQAHIVGNNDSLTYPNAYLFRNWVLEALAQDMPYDQFVTLQLAADLVEPAAEPRHRALGFLGLGPKYYARRSPEVMADEWEDRVDTVTRGLLGLTVACARCHDHKYDPIPTSDYYALAGVFASTEMFNRPLDGAEADDSGQAKKPQDAVHIVRDGRPQDLNVMVRGDVTNKGDLAPRQFLTVFSPQQPTPLQSEHSSGREKLARAITDRSNPLTARVIVNRVWHQLLGQPLVGTPSNFGALGDRPTHPELLDDLAVRFMDNGWSLKWLQREIVSSATYGQSSELSEDSQRIDPDNRWLWRVPRRRLNVESYRDAILSVAGRLERGVGGPSMQPDEPESRRRTLYSEVSRLNLNPMLARFDFPDPNAHSAARYETTTPLQKLFLLNSPFLIHQADALAERLKRHSDKTEQRIDYAYRLLYARSPSARERRLGESFVASGDDAWSQYAQALLISNEMFMVD